MKPLLALIQDRDAAVGIVGMGYVGLPLAQAFCTAGFRVLGFDIDKAKVQALAAGRSYIKHIPAQVIADMRKGNRFTATTDFARIREVDAVIICVPTPLTKQREPDISYITNTGKAIVPHMRKGQLIILESTTYPGTTREDLLPILERRGLRVGEDFYLAFARTRGPGQPQLYHAGKSPRLSAATTPPAASSPEPSTARRRPRRPGLHLRGRRGHEVTENIYRAVNIALVNELKMIYTQWASTFGKCWRPRPPSPSVSARRRIRRSSPRARPGRPLHPDRPVLPHLEGPRVRLHHEVHRVGRRDQHRHARLRRQADHGRPERRAQGHSRGEDPRPRHCLQARR